MKHLIACLCLVISCASIPVQGIPWTHFTEGLSRSSQEGKPVMVLFYASWCGACARLEEQTLSDGEISAIIGRDFIPVRMNVDGSERIPWQDRFYTADEFLTLQKISLIPALVFIEKDGTIAAAVTGFRNREEMKNLLSWIKTGSYRQGIKLEGYKTGS